MQKLIHYSVVFVCLYLASCIFGFGQGCPTIEFATPNAMPRPGDAFVVKALIKGSLGTGSLKYEWTTSSGLIEAGQNSGEISIRTSLEDAAKNISIKVNVSGLSPVCDNTASDIVGIADLTIVCGLGEEFGAEKANDVKARVDNIFIMLDNNPNTVVLFEMEFADSETPQERKMRVTRILDAIKFRKYDLNKAIFLISNNKERTTTRIRILPLSTDMSGFLAQGTLINGPDIRPKLSTLFQKN